MAQNLDQIISELDASYNPSRQTINDRINGLQGAETADVAGLEAQKNTAFDDITNGARSRGMGFSGIPLQEQAKYTSSSFLPAVAKVKQSYSEGRNSLVDALNNMNIDQRKTAMSIRETQQNRDYQQEQDRLAREAQARASQAAAGSGDALASLFGGGGQQMQAQQQQAQGTLSGNKTPQHADAAVRGLINSNNASAITSTVKAITDSAAKGNTYDQAKLQLLQKYMPGWFQKSAAGSGYLFNANYINRLGTAGQLKFKV
jgi:hypothetical protein